MNSAKKCCFQNKDVATEIRLLPLGSVQLEEISSNLCIGTIEKPLPAKVSNKVVNEVHPPVSSLDIQ